MTRATVGTGAGLCRVGGEEFVLSVAVQNVSERSVVALVAIGVPVEAASPAGDLVRAADEHLYAATSPGRDRLVGP